jgi:hypothetical protein
LAEYTRNRFAYSLALEVLRQEMEAEGFPQAVVQKAHSLCNLTADLFHPLGGSRALFCLLRRVPEAIRLDELRARYEIPQFDAAYEQYFGTVAEEFRPTTVGLRGPLLFGIAESERARLFADAVETGDYVRAGRLMTLGHDGDRLVTPEGKPYRFDVGDAAIERLAEASAPAEECPGVYGASSPALDALVDAALSAGAWGASLTGAGIAGTVLALCREGDAPAVAERIRSIVNSEAYANLAGRDTALEPDEVARTALVNQASAPAGEIAIQPVD